MHISIQKRTTIEAFETVADEAADNKVHGGDNATEVNRKGKGSSDKGNKPDIELYEWKV